LTKKPQCYNKKIILSGDYVEVYDYEKPVWYDHNGNGNGGRSVEADKDGKLRNRHITLARGKKTVRRLIEANEGKHGNRDISITLTFDEHITDKKDAWRAWKNLLYNLNYNQKVKAKAIAVPELTEKGRIHIHAIFFGIPFIHQKKWLHMWKKGLVWLNKVKDKRQLAYISKYMSKEFVDDGSGTKLYWQTGRLNKPTEVKEKEKTESLHNSLPETKRVFESTFESEQYGEIRYQKYIMD